MNSEIIGPKDLRKKKLKRNIIIICAIAFIATIVTIITVLLILPTETTEDGNGGP